MADVVSDPGLCADPALHHFYRHDLSCASSVFDGLKGCDRETHMQAPSGRWPGNGRPAWMTFRPEAVCRSVLVEGQIRSRPRVFGLTWRRWPSGWRSMSPSWCGSISTRTRESPWMLMEEAIDYTRVPAGTFRKWVAEGRIPAHGGKRQAVSSRRARRRARVRFTRAGRSSRAIARASCLVRRRRSELNAASTTPAADILRVRDAARTAQARWKKSGESA